MVNNKGYHCWIKNISKNKIVLGDLRFTLLPYQTVDLLDEKHSVYTIEQIEASINGGSIGKRLNKSIIMKMTEPKKSMDRKIKVANTSFPYKKRTIVEVKEPTYEELNVNFTVSDEQFANENAENAGSEKELYLGPKK